MQRTTLTLGEYSYELAQDLQLDELKSKVEAAIQAGGRFVDVTVVGNVAVSILATPGIPVLLTTREVLDDARDDGDLTRPFDTFAWEMEDMVPKP